MQIKVIFRLRKKDRWVNHAVFGVYEAGNFLLGHVVLNMSTIRSFPMNRARKYGYDLEVVVIDNNSTDRTAEIAQAMGATILHESKKGKGNAI